VASSSATTTPGSSNTTAIGLPRRPTRRHTQRQQHDRRDHESVQGTGCCSPGRSWARRIAWVSVAK
jgi:hypothetical protein